MHILKYKKGLLSLLIFIFIIFFLIIQYNFSMPCIFKKFLGISCPTCGMTSAFLCILNLNFTCAIYQNPLSILLFIGLIIILILLFSDFIKNTSDGMQKILSFFSKHAWLIIIILIINMIYKNIIN